MEEKIIDIAAYITTKIEGLEIAKAQDVMNKAYNQVWATMTCSKPQNTIKI